jgi:hypothetical protein
MRNPGSPFHQPLAKGWGAGLFKGMLCLNRYGDSHGGARPFPPRMRASLHAWPVRHSSVHCHNQVCDWTLALCARCTFTWESGTKD